MGIPTLISMATPSDVASQAITSGIDSTYDEYMFVFTDINISYNGSQLMLDASTDGGSNYGVDKVTTQFWTTNSESGSSDGPAYQAGHDLADASGDQPLSYQIGSNADESLAGILHLYSPSNTTYVTHFQAHMQFHTLNDEARSWFTTGYFNTTSAINAVIFSTVQGKIDSGNIQLFGIA